MGTDLSWSLFLLLWSGSAGLGCAGTWFRVSIKLDELSSDFNVVTFLSEELGDDS